LDGIKKRTPAPGLARPQQNDTAERRQVTVMFSDLVGSTALAVHGRSMTAARLF
jgi:class 3 adenylate cyclase